MAAPPQPLRPRTHASSLVKTPCKDCTNSNDHRCSINEIGSATFSMVCAPSTAPLRFAIRVAAVSCRTDVRL